jgi:hypothetical protein
MALALVGCATPAKPPAPAGSWRLQASATSGSALVRSEAGVEAVRIACRRNPPDLFISSERLPSSTAPVRLEVGRETFALAATADPMGLAATAPLPDGLAAAMMAGGEIAVAQDRRRLGPYPSPDPKTVAAFVIACRR